MGKKGKKGGGGGGRPQQGASGASSEPSAPQTQQQPQQQQQQQQQQRRNPITPQQEDFPLPGNSEFTTQQRKKKGLQSTAQQGARDEQQHIQPGPQQQQQQQQRQHGPQQQQQQRQPGPQQQQQRQPGPQQQQQQRQPGPQQQQQQRQPGPQQQQQRQPGPQQQQRQPGPQQQQQQPGSQQPQQWQPGAQQPQQRQQHRVRGPWAGPPGFSSGQGQPSPSFFRAQSPQQGLASQQQPPSAWVRNPPSSQPQTRESTPVPQPGVSPDTEQPPHLQQPVQQPRVQQPAQQPRVQQPAQQPHVQQPAQQPRVQQPAQQPSGQQPQKRSPPPSAGDRLAEQMKGLSVTSMIPKRFHPNRPNVPKKGRGINVETNHLALNIKNPNMIITHYDVSVVPEKPYRIYRGALDEVKRIHYPKRFPAFDGKKNLYSYPELPFDGELVETVNVYDSERDQSKEVTVTIREVAKVRLAGIQEYLRNGSSTNPPQDALQALDIVLRQPASSSWVTVGRSFFTRPPGQIITLGEGLDLWYGFFQSAILGWKPFLNIDVAHKGFPTPDNCVTAMSKLIRSRPGELEDKRFQLKHYQEESFVSYIKNLKVNYEIPQRGVKRTYKVTGISQCPRDNEFDLVDKVTNASTKTTVERYFLSQYRLQLRYPHLPCLTVGSNDKPISLPLELCKIMEGQVTMKKLTDNQTRTMVKEAAVNTLARKAKINVSLSQLHFPTDPHLKEFGLTVATDFTRVNARVLDPPTVDYRDSRPVSVSQGVWRNQKFLQGAELLQWRILNSSRTTNDQQLLRSLAEGLVNHGRSCGMNISDNYSIITKESPHEIENCFKKFVQEGVRLVIVILPDRGVSYAMVKKMAELQVGILTQCLKCATVKTRLSPPTFINILQKINAKLNGINHHITHSFWPKFFQKPVMVVGADVTHPAPDQCNVPSIAAVAASHDPRAFKYNMIWKLQSPRDEVIRDLKNIMREQLLKFHKATKQKPMAILFYRDGVSEGQFRQILEIELNAIRAACSSLQADYKPPITFLVVQKRHHTRFFPNKKDSEGRNINVPAGTVVDTEITHPTELDFFLVSHASIQGTARPTKYHLLWDDSDLSEQELEEITYYLCHLFTRCTRSVSYPAPTYYAHLAAFRARSYTEQERLTLNNLDMEQERRVVKPEVMANHPMYFV